MAYGQYGRYPQMKGSGFYNPMMKGLDVSGGIRDFMQQLASSKQMKSQKEQEQWKRGIIEREISLKEEQARKQPPKLKQTRWDFQKEYAQYMKSTGQWDDNQTGEYLATNKIPQVSVQVDAERKVELERFFGLKDFSQESPDDQEGYIKTYALQKNKAEPGKPIPRESIKLKQDRDKLVSPLVERYQGIGSKIDAAIFELGEPGDDPDPKHLQFRRKLHNAKKALDILLYAQSVVDGGDELSPELRKLVRQVSFKTREIQTGKFFTPDKFGYSLGETRAGKDGQEYMYLGNDQWLLKL